MLLLSTRGNLLVSSKQETLMMSSFGFAKGGSFDFNVSDTSAKYIFLGLCTTSEYNALVDRVASHGDMCTITTDSVKLSSNIPIVNGWGRFNGTVEEKNRYIPVFHTCGQEGSYFRLSYIFQNPGYLNDADHHPLINIKPVFVAYLGIILIVWFINWFTHCQLKNSLHTYLTLTFVLSFLYQLFQYLLLNHETKSDDYSVFYPASIVLRVLQETCLLSAILMVSKGWSIVRESLPCSQIILCFTVALIQSSCMAAVDYGSFGNLDFVFLVISLSACIYFYFLCVKSIEEAKQLVIAHLYVISESGIDPKTTPVYKKFTLFKGVSYSILIYFITIMFKTTALAFTSVPYYITITFYDLLLSVLITGGVWIFRIKQASHDMYIQIQGESTEIARGTILGLNLESEELHRGHQVWEEGMVLPGQPLIVETVQIDVDSSDNENNADPEQMEMENLQPQSQETHADA